MIKGQYFNYRKSTYSSKIKLQNIQKFFEIWKWLNIKFTEPIQMVTHLKIGSTKCQNKIPCFTHQGAKRLWMTLYNARNHMAERVHLYYPSGETLGNICQES